VFEEQEPEAPAHDENEPNRAPLQKLTKKQASGSIRQGTANTTGLTSAKGVVTKKPSGNSGFAIFVDENLQNGGPTSGAPTASSGWKNLAPEKDRHKENSQDATTWNKPLKVYISY
jgi:hypothetical protein